MSLNEFTNIVDDTLEELADHFDYLADKGFFSDSYDCLLAVSNKLKYMWKFYPRV